MRNQPTTEHAVAFLAMNPTFLGHVNGCDLYESPTRGDESPLLAITPSGRVRLTDHWELPRAEEATDLLTLR